MVKVSTTRFLVATLLFVVGLSIYYLIETSDDCLSLVDNRSAWKDVLSKWQQKKLILVLRHTTKCDGDLDDCPTHDEYLTDKGRQEAAVIGKGLKVLPGNYVAWHSPMTRTKDTARIAIGEQSQPKTWLATACKSNFQDYFDDIPEGNNYILVTHSNCLDSFKTDTQDFLLGFDSGTHFHFGIAAFFERVKNKDKKESRLLGCVWPEDWEDLSEIDESF